jgi:hypothetical protein
MEMLKVTSYDEKAARAARRAEVARLKREPPRFLQAPRRCWLAAGALIRRAWIVRGPL